MKQRMKVPYEKGVAIRSASSLARGIARYSAKRRQRIGGVGIQLRKLSIQTPTPLKCAEGNMNKRDSASSCSVRRSRRPHCTPRNFMHENRETSETPAAQPGHRSAGEGLSHKARAYVYEESHSGILPMNHSNKDGTSPAESGEGRPLIKENAGQPNTYPTQSGKGVSQGLAGVRKAARENKEMKFTALLHHLTVDLLRESFHSLKREAAPGVDGVTWREYEDGLEDRLIDLHGRVHRGAYRVTPSRRVYIEKTDGRQRPLAVPAIEDKLVQQAVVTILNQIYEEDFLGFSYGYRPGRSQHQALDALSYVLLKKKVNYVLDADIRGFFDNLDKSWLIKFVEHRVADPRILRLIQKWLNAGVMEEGEWSNTKTGSPQGSVITPLTQKVISNLRG
jgi:RNA-directed DNA polymerase